MARCLIIGCGCRGRALAAALRAEGHAVRGTTRSARGTAAIQAAGAEPFVGDPDRVATLSRAFEHASVAVILLGSASGSAAELSALHGTRLEMLLTRMLDTTVRSIVYEAAGSLDAEILAGGAERVRAACEASLIPYALLRADPGDAGTWTAAARDAVLAMVAA